ncbi:hypothetical protein [Gordonia sp. FQ]|uniref:hypothetical protein n=1 Tax=Gordonia sp. FQ TaxID=3446634 RepID=UPI003F8437F4
MGIRYYAYPIRPDQVGAARLDPWPFLSDDPLMDAWARDEDRPRMLYLDKCWYELQRLFVPARDDPHPRPRMAFELVRGAVSETGCGAHSPFTAVHGPDVVAAIALDLARVEPIDDEKAALIGRWNSSADYVNHYLTAAQEFTAGLTRDGLGLVYLIG